MIKDRAYWDSQFRFSVILPDFAQWPPQYEEASNSTRSRLGEPGLLAYGPDARQHVRMWHNSEKATGLFMFVHGGYWRASDAASYDFAGEIALTNGSTFANVEYRLMPGVRMGDLVADVCSALECTLDAWRGTGPVVIAGHSAGGHLIISALSGMDLPADTVAIPISGIYDLSPISQSFLQDEIHLTEDEIREYSPLHSRQQPTCKTDIIVGADETPEYHKQANAYAHKIGATRFECPNTHHMSVVSKLSDNKSPLAARICEHLLSKDVTD